jgi:peptide/nickel transport system substrate-binding protein
MHKNPFTDIRVRKAIYQAINIDEILNNSPNESNSSQFVIPLIFGYNPEIQRPVYNITNARQFMREAGYENGFYVIFDYSYDVFPTETIDFIKNQLSKINITITPNALSYEEYLSKLTTNNVSIYINCWTTGTGDSREIYDYLIGTKNQEKNIGSYNVGLYSSPEVDRLGENASVCMNTIERQHLLQECFKIAMDDVAWVPLFTWKIIWGIDNHFIWNPRADQQILIEYIRNNV